ncbi:MAG: hypothetical protein M0P71_06175 [Melioribacteraceae bacterium]|nr:hypothetical protein [Melioribacteraceae bacterium]
MISQDLLFQIKNNQDAGNFKSAHTICERKLPELTDISDISFKERKIKNLDIFYKDKYSNKIGESFSPAVINSNLMGMIFNISALDVLSQDSYIPFDISKANKKTIYTVVKNALNHYVEKYAPHIFIYDWGMENYNFYIRKPLGTGEDYNNYIKNISGNSFLLSACVSLFSALIKKSIDKPHIFSAVVDNSSSLFAIDSFDIKKQIIIDELKDAKLMVVSSKHDDKKVTKFNDFIEVCNHILPNLESHIKDQILGLGKQKISYSVTEVELVDNNLKTTLVEYNHDAIPLREIKEVNKYFFRNTDIFGKQINGVIISGIKPNYYLPTICLHGNVKNGIVNFIASRNTNDDIKEENKKCAVVIGVKSSGGTYEVGDIIYYRSIKEK